MESKDGVRISLAERVPRDRGVDAYSFLLRGREVGERLYLYALARFLVVAGIVGGAFFAKYVVGIDELDVADLMKAAALLAVYDGVVFWFVCRYRDHDITGAGRRILIGLMHGTIVLDFLFLTLALWLIGGAKSPFLTFYLFHVILAGILLSRLSTLAHALFGYLLLAGLVVGEWKGIIPRIYPAGAVVGGADLDGRYVLTVLVVYGMLFALTSLMLTGLMRLLRKGERELRSANAKLEQLSEMRRDFLHIALHNLKSPLSAVTQYLFALDVRLKGSISDEETQWIERCKVRLKDLSDFVGELQILALLETEGIEREAGTVDLRAVLTSVSAQNQDLAQMRDQTFTVELPDDLPHVHGIDRLLREAVVNFLVNAFKYTPQGGTIVLRGVRRGDIVRVEVQDNGIGISPEDQQRVFNEFVRIEKMDERIDKKMPSTGLGLSIVRRVAEILGGSVGVVSEPGKGSTFYMDLPVAKPAR